MMNKLLTPLALIPFITACAHTTPNQESTPPLLDETPPLLDETPSSLEEKTFVVLEGESITEQELGNYTMWNCTGSRNEKDILLKVGILHEVEHLGFILYDGKNSGDFTHYFRQGLSRRWNWEDSYSFIIEADGTGLYFDFTHIASGETTTANSVYKCHQH